jgi:sulfite reductase (NADPH) hemoprotein beta-component
VTIQRDNGDRSERKHARFKYTIDDRGLEWLHAEIEDILGYRLAKNRPFDFTHNGDLYGWQQTTDGLWHLGLFLENGRVADRGGARQMSGLRAIAEVLKGEFRLTPNQNVIISNVNDSDRDQIDRLVKAHGLDNYRYSSPMRLHSMACVGFPTCGLSMAESERYLPELVDLIEEMLVKHDLEEQPITIRMTGCPNGCARPYLAEIGLVGKGPGLYNLHLGAAFNGTRLNQKVRESVHEEEILVLLDELLADYSSKREPNEAFGDFMLRSGVLQAGMEQAAV